MVQSLLCSFMKSESKRVGRDGWRCEKMKVAGREKWKLIRTIRNSAAEGRLVALGSWPCPGVEGKGRWADLWDPFDLCLCTKMDQSLSVCCYRAAVVSTFPVRLKSLAPFSWENLFVARFRGLPVLFILHRNADNETSSSMSASDQSRHPFEVSLLSLSQQFLLCHWIKVFFH